MAASLPKPFWKGFLKFSLVNCPVAMMPAVTESEKIKFHTLNRETGNSVDKDDQVLVLRARRKRICDPRKRRARIGRAGKRQDDRYRHVCLQRIDRMDLV
jgi:hypothetical protein